MLPLNFRRHTMVIYPIILCLLIFTIPDGVKADKADFNAPSPVIAIDPGHGGQETGGAAGPDTLWEKDITLLLAGQLADRLRPSYTAVLTRTGDYHLDLFDRTAAANHATAEMLISLHTGGSYLHKAEGITIWHYKPAKAAFSAPDPNTIPPWSAVQLHHTASSRVLAELLRARLNKITSFIPVKLNTAPILLLEGADMPAVLIETGYLTNPSEKAILRNPDRLSELADAMASAIDDFFQKNPARQPNE